MNFKIISTGLSLILCSYLDIQANEFSNNHAKIFSAYEQNIQKNQKESYGALCDYLLNQSKVIYLKIAKDGIEKSDKQKLKEFLDILDKVAIVAKNRAKKDTIFRQKDENIYYSVLALMSIINAAVDDEYMKIAKSFDYETLANIDIIKEGKKQADLSAYLKNIGA